MKNAAGYLFLTLTTFTLLGSMAVVNQEAVVAQAQPAPNALDKEAAKVQAQKDALQVQLDAINAKLAQPKKLPDPPGFKFGYIKPKATIDAGKFKIVILKDGRQKIVPRLGAYVKPTQSLLGAPIPASVDYTPKALASIKRFFLNDQLGDCVVASLSHRIGVWTANDAPGTVIMPTDAEVRARYQKWCGPGDNGCNITDVLDGHKRDGMPCNGTLHKIDDYVAVDWTNADEVKTALVLFGGGMCVGFDLPQGWYNAQDVWSIANATGGIVGGHDVPQFGYNAQGVIASTWGGLRTWEWPAFTSKKWISECYVSLSPDWYGADGISGSGLDVKALKADLAMLGQGQIPPLPDPTPPPPSGVTVAFADFTAVVNVPVTISAFATGGKAPYTWGYDYGDGTPVGTFATHTYTMAGTYSVKAQATDSTGTVGSATAKLVVSSTPVPPPPGTQATVQFNGTGSPLDGRTFYLTDKAIGDMRVIDLLSPKSK